MNSWYKISKINPKAKPKQLRKQTTEYYTEMICIKVIFQNTNNI